MNEEERAYWEGRYPEQERARYAKALELVQQQAEDDGLWFVGLTAPEGYLQEALRRLHAAIEGDPFLGGPHAEPGPAHIHRSPMGEVPYTPRQDCASCRVEPSGALVCVKDDEPGSWIPMSDYGKLQAERDALRDELAALQEVCNAMTTAARDAMAAWSGIKPRD